MRKNRQDQQTATKFLVSSHAAQRYIERFEGNITFEKAVERIKNIARHATFDRSAPGGASTYTTHGYVFIVHRSRILTVYGVNTDSAPDDGYAMRA